MVGIGKQNDGRGGEVEDGGRNALRRRWEKGTMYREGASYLLQNKGVASVYSLSI